MYMENDRKWIDEWFTQYLIPENSHFSSFYSSYLNLPFEPDVKTLSIHKTIHLRPFNYLFLKLYSKIAHS